MVATNQQNPVSNIEIVTNGRKVNVYKTLRDAIQFLVLKPGSVISEADLKEHLGVSRTPIREALIRLADEHLVDVYPQRGTYVSEIDLKLAKEMAYLRHIVETEILMELCRSKIDLGSTCEESLFFMKQALSRNDVIAYIRADAMFHQAMFEYAGHSPIWDVISVTRVQYVRFLMLELGHKNQMDKSYSQHLKIIRLIADGRESELKELLEDHHDHKNLDHGDKVQKQFAEYFGK